MKLNLAQCHSYHDFLHNPGSMTAELHKISNNLKVSVIPANSTVNKHARLVVLSLDNVPVLVGYSISNRADHIFYDILTNSDNQPIGLSLFANPEIQRTKLLVRTVTIGDIGYPEIIECLHNLGEVSDVLLDQRFSEFTSGGQRMYLYEYILPGLQNIVSFNKYN